MSIETEGVSLADATGMLAGLEDGGSETEALDPNGGEGEALEDAGMEQELAELEAGEGEAQEEDQDQDEAEYEDGEDEIHLVKVDGEEIEVPYKELVDGYQRQADYTRKTQELAVQRREIEGVKNNLNMQAVSYAQAYLQTANTIAALAPSENDIKDAYATDPMRAAELQQRREGILRQAVETRNLAVSIHGEIQQSLKQKMADAGQKLPEFVPEWSDAETRKTEITSIAEYLVQQGLNPQEVERTAEPAAWAIARKAWLFDQLQQGTAAKEDKPTVPKIRKTRATKPRLKGGRKRLHNNRQAFNQNPTRDNATALLAQFEE